ncbi:Cindoxin [compost metagenome]
MAADDIAAYIEKSGSPAQIIPMEEFNVEEMQGVKRLIVITSTYGEGELPETTAPFYEALITQSPDLSGVEFAAFGLGDSTYETYGNGIDVVSAKLKELGATQVGETGRHDAAKGEALADVAVNWITETLPLFELH